MVTSEKKVVVFWKRKFLCGNWNCYVGVSKNRGTPKSSILIGFSIINHPFWGIPIFGNTHVHISSFFLWGGVHLLEKDQRLVLQLLQKDQSAPKEKQDIASLRPIVCFKQFSS